MDAGRAPRGGITLGRRKDRAHDELVGLCRGLLADGHVSAGEAEFLRDWIERNAAFADAYPFGLLLDRLNMVLADGEVDADESADLHDTLVRFVGGEAFDAQAQTASLSSALPLDDPMPMVEFPGTVFLATGTFRYGPRKDVYRQIVDRGGVVASSVVKSLNFLVVGELGSRDWMHSNSGRKIEKAIALRSAGQRLALVSEAHWVAFLD